MVMSCRVSLSQNTSGAVMKTCCIGVSQAGGGRQATTCCVTNQGDEGRHVASQDGTQKGAVGEGALRARMKVRWGHVEALSVS